MKKLCCIAIMRLLLAGTARADRYVATNGVVGGDYDMWSAAADNIANAVTAANPGETVWVSNGTYNAGITVAKAVTVESVNGAEVTIVNGNNASRGFWINDADAVVDGFTITNCYASQGCGFEIRENGGTLRNCIVVGNRGGRGHGGSVLSSNAVVENCEIAYNEGSGGGGGIAFYWSSYGSDGTGGTVRDCRIHHNRSNVGGGIYVYDGFQYHIKHPVVENCEITDNLATNGWGGGVYLLVYGKLRNCLIANNSASGPAGKGRGGGIFIHSLDQPAAWIESCTIVSNSSTEGVGGVWRETGCSGDLFFNTILSSNANGDVKSGSEGFFTFCCASDLNDGVDDNITNNPSFADFAAGDYTLQRGSPCINTGSNQTWMSSAHDLNDQPRLATTTVDMGCYEYQPKGTAILVQ